MLGLSGAVCARRGDAVAEPHPTFAGLLRDLRTQAGLTQEELAEAAGLSARSISDLERGVNLTARKDTARLLADALHLTGAARTEFEAAARGRAAPTPGAGTGEAAAATRTLPRDIASFTGRQQELQELVAAAASAGAVVSIHAIGGMAGIGKTAFAVHAAPTRRPVPGRADLPAPARPHPRPPAGRPGRRAGQPAADRRSPGGADPAWPGGADGAVAGPAGR